MIANFHNLPGLMSWLASGRRGISSNSIVQHITGMQTLRDGWRVGIPHDPDDLDRCLQLLEAVPLLRLALPEMATASPLWAALIARWAEIEASHLAEVGLGWTKAKSAPKTYALMRSVIDPAREEMYKARDAATQAAAAAGAEAGV